MVTEMHLRGGFCILHIMLCKFSVASGALYDVKRHASRLNHIKAVKAKKTSLSLNSFVAKKKIDQSILTETLFSNFVAEHNVPFSKMSLSSMTQHLNTKLLNVGS